MNEKRGHATSEPEDFLLFAERMNSWALMVALIGEGQEIHLGEESGLFISWILDFLVNIPAVSNTDYKDHKLLVEDIEYNRVITNMERIKG